MTSGESWIKSLYGSRVICLGSREKCIKIRENISISLKSKVFSTKMFQKGAEFYNKDEEKNGDGSDKEKII